MNQNILSRHRWYNNQWFAKWAWLYDYEKYLTFPLRKKAAKFLNSYLTPHQKILDVATGTGLLAYECAELGHQVIGIDLSQEMLEQAKKKYSPFLKLSFQIADATDLPFADDSFDAGTISFGLHDMPYEIDLLVLEEMKRVIKKGGKILIVDYMEPKKHFVAKFFHPIVSLCETVNYKPFIERGLDAILEETDLKINQSANFLGMFQVVIAQNNK